MRRTLEDTIQIHLVRWCHDHENEVLHNIFHIPNGGYRDKITASILKAMGVKAGATDLCLPLPGGRVYWLEMKTKKGRVSKAQKKFHCMLRDMGHIVGIAYGLDHGKELLEDVVKLYD